MADKQSKYERIKNRPDKRRPMYVKEVATARYFKECPEGFVLKIKVLTPSGGTIEVTWTEKDANEMAARDALGEKTT